jgi:hypothetical protein
MDAFSEYFLDNYLRFGLGSMPKADIDALVMHLIDVHGDKNRIPLAHLSNQQASERLKTSVSKIKKLRYEAALKFSTVGIKQEAKARLLVAFSKANLEIDFDRGDKIHLIIEDILAKNWLQGQLKEQQTIFDNSFNTELVRVDAEGLFKVLKVCFGGNQDQRIKTFIAKYETLRSKKRKDDLKAGFQKILKDVVVEIGKETGLAGVQYFKTYFRL